MNTGQMLLVIGAFALLSTIALSVNSTLLDNQQVALEAQYGVMAVSLCQGEIETLVAANFGSLAIGISTDTLLTPLAAFVCTARVDYVQAAFPDVVVGGPTSLKRVRVTVSNEYMTGGVTLRAIMGDY